MESDQQPETRRNHFYPNCGCGSEADCSTCPHCGMCITHAASCACGELPLGTDVTLGFDPHLEILGG